MAKGLMELYTGILPRGTDSCLAATMELLHRVRAEYVVIKLGNRGSFVCNGRHFKVFSAFSVKEVDHGGAGDAFFAALSLFLSEEGADVSDAMRYATAVAALTVTKEGEGYALPDAETVAAFLETHDAM